MLSKRTNGQSWNGLNAKSVFICPNSKSTMETAEQRVKSNQC